MKKIAVVIVTYNNRAMLETLLSDLSIQTRKVDAIFIVDNAGSETLRKIITQGYRNVTYICMPGNTGASGGYCAGLSLALAQGSDYILTLDDDVRLNESSIAELEKGLERCQKVNKVAAVSAVGQESSLPDSSLEIFSWRGTLFDAAAVRAAGLPVMDFFIYGCDLEYALRLGRLGYSFFWIHSSRCFNPRSTGKKQEFLFGKKIYYYTEPFRSYYAFRNEFYIYLQYRLFTKAVKLIGYAIRVIIAVICFKHVQRGANIAAVLRGLYDGVSGKLGICARYTRD